MKRLLCLMAVAVVPMALAQDDCDAGKLSGGVVMGGAKQIRDTVDCLVKKVNALRKELKEQCMSLDGIWWQIDPTPNPNGFHRVRIRQPKSTCFADGDNPDLANTYTFSLAVSGNKARGYVYRTEDAKPTIFGYDVEIRATSPPTFVATYTDSSCLSCNKGTATFQKR